MHGYDIAKAVENKTDGCCSPTEGTIYPVMKQFETGDYVTCETEVVSGRERKVYTLTQKGKDAFQIALKEWMKVTACFKTCEGYESACKSAGC